MRDPWHSFSLAALRFWGPPEQSTNRPQTAAKASNPRDAMPRSGGFAGDLRPEPPTGHGRCANHCFRWRQSGLL